MSKEKDVRYIKRTVANGSGAVSELRSCGKNGDGWKKMSRKDFLKMCGEFWDGHMTNLDDFDTFEVELKREPQ